MSTITNENDTENDTENDVVVEAEIPTNPDVVEAENTEAEDARPGREAAKYRRQLREVEAERDGLRATVEALRRAEVARLATAAKVKPEAVWAAGTDVADLLADDGSVDPAKVTDAIKATREALGIAPPRVAPYGGDWQGNRGEPISTGEPEKRFADAFRPRRT